jgi:tetratricopeptide (TPR) repeat protein
MLTTKNRVSIGRAGIVTLSMAWWLFGCTPAGPRALLDGERLLSEGQFEPAAQRLERAVQLIPGNAQAWNHLGLAYHRAGRLDDATKAYQQSLILDRELASARFNLGCLDLDRGDAEGAIRELTSYLIVQPNSTAGWLKLGTAQLRARQTDAAERSFRQALQIDGQLPEGWNGLGLVQVQRRRYPEAYQHFQAATRTQPDYAPALRNAAIVAHQFLKNRHVALQKYQELLALPNVPDMDSIEFLAAQLQDELAPPSQTPARPPQIALAPKPISPPAAEEKPAESLDRPSSPPSRVTRPKPAPVRAPPPTTPTPAPTKASPQEATRAVPSDLQPAVVPEPKPAPKHVPETEPPELARRVERPAVVSEPVVDGLSPFPRYRYRALGDFKQGDRAAAERLLEEGYRAHTRYRFAEAVGAYQRAIQSDPSFFDAHYNLGVAAFENGDLRLALSAYETALAIQPDSLKARFNFASTLDQAGYPRDAADELEQLVARHPAEVRIHSALANLYARKLDDARRARGHYQRVLELDPRYPEATAIRYWLERNR